MPPGSELPTTPRMWVWAPLIIHSSAFLSAHGLISTPSAAVPTHQIMSVSVFCKPCCSTKKSKDRWHHYHYYTRWLSFPLPTSWPGRTPEREDQACFSSGGSQLFPFSSCPQLELSWKGGTSSRRGDLRGHGEMRRGALSIALRL